MITHDHLGKLSFIWEKHRNIFSSPLHRILNKFKYFHKTNYTSNNLIMYFNFFQGKHKGILNKKSQLKNVCLTAGLVSCRLWLLTHQSCWAELPALLQKPRNALRGILCAELEKTSADSRGSSNFALFFPLQDSYHSFRTKQTNNRKR